MSKSRLRFPSTFRERTWAQSPVGTPELEERVLETPDLVKSSQFIANDEEIEQALSEPLSTLDFDLEGIGAAAPSIAPKTLEQRPPPRFQVPSSDSGEDSVLPTPEKPCGVPVSSPPVPKSTSSHDSGIEIPSSPMLKATTAPRSSPHHDTAIPVRSKAEYPGFVGDIEAQTEAVISNAEAQKSAKPVSDNTRAAAKLDSVTLLRMLAAAAFLVPEMEESHLAAAVKQVQTWSMERAGLNILIKTILAKAANAEEADLFQSFVRDAETYLIAQGKLEKTGTGANSVAAEHDAVVDDRMKSNQDHSIGTCSPTSRHEEGAKETKGTATPNSTELPASSQPRSLQEQVDKSISHILERKQLDKALAIWQVHQEAIYDRDVKDLLEKFLQSRASRDESQRFRTLLKVKQDRFKIHKKSPNRKIRMVSRAIQTDFSAVDEPRNCTGREIISTATQTDEVGLQVLTRSSDSLKRPPAESEEDVPVEETNNGNDRSTHVMDDGQQNSRENSQIPKKRECEPDPQPDLISTPAEGPFRSLQNLQRKRQKREDARKFAKFLMQTEDGRDSQLYLDLLERSEQGRKRRDSNAAKTASRRLHAALSDSSSVCEGVSTPRSTPNTIYSSNSLTQSGMRFAADTNVGAIRVVDAPVSSSKPSSDKTASPDAVSPDLQASKRSVRYPEASPADSGATTAQACKSEDREESLSGAETSSVAQPSLTDCDSAPCGSTPDTSETTSDRSKTNTKEPPESTGPQVDRTPKPSEVTFAALKPPAPSPPNIASPPRSPQLLHCKRCDYHAYGSGDHSRYCHGYRALRKANKAARRLEDRLRKQAQATTAAQDMPKACKKSGVVETEEETYRIATGNPGRWNVRRGSLAYKSWR